MHQSIGAINGVLVGNPVCFKAGLIEQVHERDASHKRRAFVVAALREREAVFHGKRHGGAHGRDGRAVGAYDVREDEQFLADRVQLRRGRTAVAVKFPMMPIG